MSVLHKIKNKKQSGKSQLAILIDPDKFSKDVVLKANEIADFFLVGGSILNDGELQTCVKEMKSITNLPIIIFPGDSNQLDKNADATLLLSLISGRNPDYLIGKHVEAAQDLKKLDMEIIPTAYILIDGGNISTTQHVTKTEPLPNNDIKLIVNTALAGELLGFKLIYLEAGSGATSNVNTESIKAVKKECKLPVMVGGGIDSRDKFENVRNAGADVIVIGNALEKNLYLLEDLKETIK